MPYRIETYKSVLDKYLHSGIKYLRYTCQRIGEAKVYFPYINEAQIRDNIHNQLFMSGGRAYYKTSMPYSTWEWFSANYDIQGIDEFDGSKDEQFFVMVIGDKAALIPITSQNFPMGELNHKAVYSVQHKFLNKAVERVCRNGYYRCIFTNGQFVFHDRGLSFEQMVKVAQNVDYVGDNLFVDYVKTLSVDEVYAALFHIQNRYVKGCRTSDAMLSRQDWVAHTKRLFEGITFSTPQEEAVRSEINDYCDGVKKTQSSPVQADSSSHKSHFTNVAKQSTVLKKLCLSMKGNGLLDRSTKEDDFVYYLRGEGEKPQKKLRWTSDITTLMFIIYILCGEKPQWTITSRVFEGVKESTLRSLYSRLKQDESDFEERKDYIDSKYIKAALSS